MYHCPLESRLGSAMPFHSWPKPCLNPGVSGNGYYIKTPHFPAPIVTLWIAIKVDGYSLWSLVTYGGDNKVFQRLDNILLCHYGFLALVTSTNLYCFRGNFYIQLFSLGLSSLTLLLLLSVRVNFFQREILLGIDSRALDNFRFSHCCSAETAF